MIIDFLKNMFSRDEDEEIAKEHERKLNKVRRVIKFKPTGIHLNKLVADFDHSVHSILSELEESGDIVKVKGYIYTTKENEHTTMIHIATERYMDIYRDINMYKYEKILLGDKTKLSEYQTAVSAREQLLENQANILDALGCGTPIARCITELEQTYEWVANKWSVMQNLMKPSDFGVDGEKTYDKVQEAMVEISLTLGHLGKRLNHKLNNENKKKNG